MAFSEYEPWGQGSATWQLAVIASIVANAAGKHRYKPKDFMPKPPPAPGRNRFATPDEIAAVFHSIAARWPK